jgi:starch phosphorylase
MSLQQASDVRTGLTVESLKRDVKDNLYFMRGQNERSASQYDHYMTLAYAVRDRLVHRWRQTLKAHHEAEAKTVYYLSAEYLLGRQLLQGLLSCELIDEARKALDELGLDLDTLVEQEIEPGLGNGGLGRLGACFLDSLATLDIPSMGYGIRYEFGIFKQSFQDGEQVESADDWLYLGSPWEFAQPDDMVEVQFEGHTEYHSDETGRFHVRWIPGRTVLGVPYHMLVPGYDTRTVNRLRLWGARASKAFDFALFNEGDYSRAVAHKTATENITKVLYPNDHTPQGRQLRLEQQYFLVSCSLQDIIRRFRMQHDDWTRFPDKVAIQLNDTHPTIAIAELMRLLMDVHDLEWGEAWKITHGTFAATQHTLLPEALETWPVTLVGHLLPRHLEIIYEINRRFLQEVEARFPGEPDRKARMSVIGDGGEKVVRMANLAIVGSYSVNGVARLQSELLKTRVFRDFYELWPEKFNNKTNGVTPRRFMRLANPRLSALITEKVGEGWLKDLSRLEGLEAYVDDPDFQAAWRTVKHQNKQDLAAIIRRETGFTADPDTLFDVMVKRIHEYKRQLLKAFHIITLYNRIKANPGIDLVPRTFVFGGKAAPGYFMAKRIIRLINAVADVVNADAEVAGRLKVAFLPNFNVTLAQRIYPAADVSEQISLAGKEASGTGNMKFALNGAVTTGTLDGANIEIRELVGEDNFFLFGLTAEEVFALKEQGYNPLDYYHANAELKQVVDQIADGFFSDGDQETFKPIVASLMYHDEYLVFADYASYVACQERAAEAYRDPARWTRMSILNVARCGYFSSDRTIREYCEDIWKVEPVHVEPEEVRSA